MKQYWIIMLFKAAGVLWRNGGREVARSLIDDPKHTWDDAAMAAVDKLFGAAGENSDATSTGM